MRLPRILRRLTRRKRPEPGVDYEAWALEMCELLDAIERIACNEDLRMSQGSTKAEIIVDICKARFAIARKHGITVEFLGPTSGEVH